MIDLESDMIMELVKYYYFLKCIPFLDREDTEICNIQK